MSDTELAIGDWVNEIAFYLIIFGVPVCALFIKRKWSRVPTVILFFLSAVGVFVTLQFWQSFLDAPIADEYRSRLPLDDDHRLGDAGAGAATLLLGLPIGLIGTSIVFGLFYLLKVLLRKRLPNNLQV